MHVRGQIRARITTVLSAIPGLQDHVTIDWRDIPDQAEMPWAWVWIGNETITARTVSGKKQQRELELYIDLISRDIREVATQAESIAASIESALAADRTLGDLAKDCDLRAYTVDRDNDGSQPMMRLRLQYLITYMTAATDPETAL